jgi:hypothetical protein
MAAVGSNRTFAALSTDGSNADKPALGSNSGLWRSRPKPAVHSLDRMILHRSDSGHSFQVQQSHGSEGWLSGTFQN